jgi:hypothetical protein
MLWEDEFSRLIVFYTEGSGVKAAMSDHGSSVRTQPWMKSWRMREIPHPVYDWENVEHAIGLLHYETRQTDET